MLEVHRIQDADSIFPHRQRFELFGRLNIKARLTKMNIFFGIGLQMLCHIVINLGVDTCLMCFIMVFCSFRVEIFHCVEDKKKSRRGKWHERNRIENYEKLDPKILLEDESDGE